MSYISTKFYQRISKYVLKINLRNLLRPWTRVSLNSNNSNLWPLKESVLKVLLKSLDKIEIHVYMFVCINEYIHVLTASYNNETGM